MLKKLVLASILLLVSKALEISSPEDIPQSLEHIGKWLNLSEPQWFTEQDPAPNVSYIKNIIMRLAMTPRASRSLFDTIFPRIASQLVGKKLPDLNLNIEALDMTFVSTNNVIHKAAFVDPTGDAGVHPLTENTFNVTLPGLNISITFNYSILFGKNETTHGNGTFTGGDISLVLKLYNWQEEIAGQPIGRIFLECLGVHMNYEKFDMVFSNPYTQIEWDEFFKHKELVILFGDYILNFLIESKLKVLDLRNLINFSFGQGINVLMGISEMIRFNPTGLPPPQDRYTDLKVHSIMTLPSGMIVEGLFDTDMTAALQSTKYSSLVINIDVMNKILKALSYNQALNLSFNQKLFDTLKFGLLRLDTTSLKAFFPRLEIDYGAGLGVWMHVFLPQYDSNRCYAKNSQGHVSYVLALNIEIYVDKDTWSNYYHGSLKKCIANNTCVLALTLELDLYANIPLQFSKAKQLIVGFIDAEITNVYAFPKTVDPDILKLKLNNFIEISLPHLIQPIDLSALFPNSMPSVDVLDDQRIFLSSKSQSSLGKCEPISAIRNLRGY